MSYDRMYNRQSIPMRRIASNPPIKENSEIQVKPYANRMGTPIKITWTAGGDGTVTGGKGLIQIAANTTSTNAHFTKEVPTDSLFQSFRLEKRPTSIRFKCTVGKVYFAFRSKATTSHDYLQADAWNEYAINVEDGDFWSFASETVNAVLFIYLIY